MRGSDVAHAYGTLEKHGIHFHLHICVSIHLFKMTNLISQLNHDN